MKEHVIDESLPTIDVQTSGLLALTSPGSSPIVFMSLATGGWQNQPHPSRSVYPLGVAMQKRFFEGKTWKDTAAQSGRGSRPCQETVNATTTALIELGHRGGDM